MTIVFAATKSKRFRDILAHPEIHFNDRVLDGPLFGLRLTGLTLVRGRDNRLTVTFPFLQRNGVKYYIFQRIQPDERTKLTKHILEAWAKLHPSNEGESVYTP